MVFKQLLQAEAIDVCQIDSCRLAGVSEVLSVLLMAAKCVASMIIHAPQKLTSQSTAVVGLVFLSAHMRVVLACVNM